MFYVNWLEYFPIYCPAEGGFYVSGQQIVLQKKCKTLKQANRVFAKWLRAFREEYNNDYYRYSEIIRGGVTKYGTGSSCIATTKYIGEGGELNITRTPEKELSHYIYE